MFSASLALLDVLLASTLALAPETSGPAERGEAPSDEPAAGEPVEVPLVLIHVAPDRPDIRARLQAELGLLGYVSERIVLSDDANVLGPDLIDRLEPAGASAAIEIALTAERINVWVADRATGTTLHRRFDLVANPELADARSLAISAVELLRASESSEPEPPPPRPPAVDGELPPEDVDPPEPARPLRGAISLVPLVTASPGGFNPAAHVELAARWAPIDRFALRFSIWVPTVVTRIVRDEGNARLLYGMVFVEPQLRLPGGATWFHPELGLGLGLSISNIVGQAVAPYRSNAKTVPGFVSHAHLGFGFAVTPRVWIRLDGYVGVMTPGPRVTFAGESVATWGLPWGSGSLGVELWF